MSQINERLKQQLAQRKQQFTEKAQRAERARKVVKIVRKQQSSERRRPVPDTPTAFIESKATTEEKQRIQQIKRSPFTPLKPGLTQLAYEQALRRMSEEEKHEFGYRYTEWEDVPVEDRPRQYGFQQYWASLSEEEKKKIVEQYKGSQKFKSFKESPGGRYQREEIARSELEKEISKEYGPLATYTTGVYDYETAETIMARGHYTESSVFSDLSLRSRIRTSLAESGLRAVSYPITLPQTAIKYATGSGDWTDVGGRVSSGQTLGYLPDVSKEIDKLKISPTEGAISGLIGEAISGGKSTYLETAEKYPLETAAATTGEGFGLITAGSAVGAVKTATTRGLDYVGLRFANTPIYSRFYAAVQPYTPKNLIRKAYWKYRKYTGSAKELPPEMVFKESALPSDLSMAPGGSPQQRINSLVKAFDKSRSQTVYGDQVYTGVHTTTSPWMKPFVFLKKGRESPGVSFAPFGEGSPRFLRIGGPNTSYPSGISLLPKINLPTSPVLYFKNLIHMPKNLISSGYKAMNKFIKGQGSGVFVAPKMYLGGGEYEVIARGMATRLGVRSFTTVGKVVVPIPEFTMTSFSPSLLSRFGGAAKSAFVSSYGSVSVPYFAPGYLFTSSVSSSPSMSYPYSLPSYSLSSMLSSSVASSSVSSSPIRGYSTLPSSGSSTGSSIGSSLSSPRPSYGSSFSSSYSYTPFKSKLPFSDDYMQTKRKRGQDRRRSRKGYRERFWDIDSEKILGGNIFAKI